VSGRIEDPEAGGLRRLGAGQHAVLPGYSHLTLT
jgi:hypothetical protein